MKQGAIFILLSLFFLGGCTQEKKRKVVKPGSNYSDMGWNRPQPGESQGALGPFMQQR